VKPLEPANPARALATFRRRLDGFFGDPRTAGLVQAAAADGPSSRLHQRFVRLASGPAGQAFTLRKSLMLRDGRIVGMTGDATPLGADEDVRVVTTTTSVLDSGAMRVETSVLVFERDARS
jgi:hypothetical protein